MVDTYQVYGTIAYVPTSLIKIFGGTKFFHIKFLLSWNPS